MIEWIVSSSILILFVIGIRILFRKKIKQGIRYALWLVVLVRLLIPFSVVKSDVSIMNIVSQIANGTSDAIKKITTAEGDADKSAIAGGNATGVKTNIKVDTNVKVKTNITTNVTTDTNQKSQTNQKSNWLLGTQGKTNQLGNVLLIVLISVWGGGALLVMSAFVISNAVFTRRLHTGRRVFDVESKLPVYVADVIQTPCMFGVFRPAIYITEEVANDKNTLRYVLAHEEMHYRHGDNWWTVLRSICLIVHWYNPLVWLAAILSKADAELACDEATLKHLGSQERFAYGQVLIELSTKKSSSREFLRCATTMKSNKKQMKERIQFISRKPRMLIQAFVIVVGLIAIAVIVTFTGQKASDDSAAEEFTKMETWNSASLKGVVAHSKGDNAEISQEQSALEDIAQDDSQENGTEDGVSGNIDIQEDGYSMNKQIVGTSITPSAELVSALEGEVEDWRRDFFTFANRALMAMNEEEDNENKNEEFRNAYYLVGETSSFITYGKGDLNSFVIKTNEGDYIAVDSPYTSNYCVSPVFGEKDYDGDGDEELAIITYFLHGTGVSIYTLYMVDKQADGQWNVYQYCAENYLSQLGEHYETVIDAQGIQLKVDSALVGRKIAIENKTYLYTAGDQIGFELRDNTIKMNALITASNTKLNEPRYIYSEDGLKADVLYMGDGKWGLSKVAYYNDGIESMMASIVEFYFYNNSDMLNIYAAKDTSLETYGETVRELPKTINISYDSKLMNEDKLIVSACLLSTPTSDSYDYLTCELVYEDSEDSPVGVWRIRSIGLEK